MNYLMQNENNVNHTDKFVFAVVSGVLLYIICKVFSIGTVASTILGCIILICSLSIFFVCLGVFGVFDFIQKLFK